MRHTCDSLPGRERTKGSLSRGPTFIHRLRYKLSVRVIKRGFARVIVDISFFFRSALFARPLGLLFPDPMYTSAWVDVIVHGPV
jgi:hypothetical protein